MESKRQGVIDNLKARWRKNVEEQVVSEEISRHLDEVAEGEEHTDPIALLGTDIVVYGISSHGPTANDAGGCDVGYYQSIHIYCRGQHRKHEWLFAYRYSNRWNRQDLCFHKIGRVVDEGNRVTIELIHTSSGTPKTRTVSFSF